MVTILLRPATRIAGRYVSNWSQSSSYSIASATNISSINTRHDQTNRYHDSKSIYTSRKDNTNYRAYSASSALVRNPGLGYLNNLQQIRFNTTNAATTTTTTTTTDTSNLPTIASDPADIASRVLQWEDVPKEVAISAVDTVKPVVTGAILPFSQLYFFQVLILPYTYVAMYYMDFLLHYLPWWAAIVGTTATARLLFFPVVLTQNKQGIKTYNILPQTQKLQEQMHEATLNGDAYNQAIVKSKLYLLNKEHGLTMKSRLLPILFSAPMYASIFLLLRVLTGIPAEGLATGGALWFTDLTVPDPYYILPLMTSTSMFALLEFGLEGGMNPTAMGPLGRYFLRALPVGLFFFIQSFPAATLLFWSTSNMFTLFYALTLKNPWVKKKLDIPVRLVHNPEDLPLTKTTFKTQMKKAMESSKSRKTSMDVRRLDDISFRKAGIGPLRKTYKELPKEV